MQTIGKKLKELRKKSKMTQFDVVASLSREISRSDLSKVESDRKMPSFFLLCELADLYNVPIDFFRTSSPVSNFKINGEFIKDATELAIIRAWRAMDDAEKVAFATMAETVGRAARTAS